MSMLIISMSTLTKPDASSIKAFAGQAQNPT
jgi:hypothetical protein